MVKICKLNYSLKSLTPPPGNETICNSVDKINLDLINIKEETDEYKINS